MGRSPKVAILLNPAAGGGRALGQKPRLEALLRRHGVPYDLFVTESEEELKRLARELPGSYEALAGAGGDSTYHLIVNELIRGGADVPFGLIGLGSSNDIPLEFGLDTLDKACAALKRRMTRRIDAGVISHQNSVLRYFLGQANIGLGAFVNQDVARTAAERPRLAKRQTLAGLRAVRRAFEDRVIPLRLSVRGDGQSVEGDLLIALVGNMRYWASGKLACPSARPDDGRLDACLFRPCRFSRLARLAWSARRGRHVHAPEVTTLSAPAFEVSSDKDFLVQTDGEILGGQATPARFKEIRFSLKAKALTIIV